MRVTVLGGGGFIGSAIVDRFLKDDHEVTVFERPRVPPYRAFSSNERVIWLNGDFASAFDVQNAVGRADLVIHLISTTLPKSSSDDPIYDVESNLVSSLQLFQICARNSVGRVIFISSGGTVYGVPKYIPMDERHQTEPSVFYGVTKLAIEKYLYLFEKNCGMTGISLRVANPYGERQRVETAQGAVGVFLRRALEREVVEIWGDGSVVRDFLHVSDVAEAFYRAAFYGGKERVFNVGSGAGVSLNELLGLISNEIGRTVDVLYKPGRAFDVPVSVLCNSLAQRELGWMPKVPLDEGLRRTIAWIRSAK